MGVGGRKRQRGAYADVAGQRYKREPGVGERRGDRGAGILVHAGVNELSVGYADLESRGPGVAGGGYDLGKRVPRATQGGERQTHGGPFQSSQ